MDHLPATLLGVRPDGDGPAASLHSNRLVIDERAMVVGAALHAAVELSIVAPELWS